MSYKLYFSYNSKNISRRKGVSEIISSLFLLAITVVGGITIVNMVQNNIIDSNMLYMLDKSSALIKLIGYDARDNKALLSISNLNNFFDDNSQLCASSCSANADKIPKDLGTEFIVLKIRNTGVTSLFLDSILINNINHAWDPSTAGVPLDASKSITCSSLCSYPHAGKFSIITLVSVQQRVTSEILSGEEVRVIIKLSKDISDIRLHKPILIEIPTSTLESLEFVIESGIAR